MTQLETDRPPEETVEDRHAEGGEEAAVETAEAADCTCEGGIVRLPTDSPRPERT